MACEVEHSCGLCSILRRSKDIEIASDPFAGGGGGGALDLLETVDVMTRARVGLLRFTIHLVKPRITMSKSTPLTTVPMKTSCDVNDNGVEGGCEGGLFDAMALDGVCLGGGDGNGGACSRGGGDSNGDRGETGETDGGEDGSGGEGGLEGIGGTTSTGTRIGTDAADCELTVALPVTVMKGPPAAAMFDAIMEGD